MKAYIIYRDPSFGANTYGKITLKHRTKIDRDNIEAVLKYFLGQGHDVSFFTDRTQVSRVNRAGFR